MKAIFAREIKGLFNTFSGYIFIAVFLLGGGILFAVTNLAEGSARLTSVLWGMHYVLLLIIPVITVRIFEGNKELKALEKLFPKVSKSIDRTLYSAPVSSVQIAAGKYFSAVSVLAISLIISFIYPVILAVLGSVTWGETIAGFLGLFLYGGLLISIGVFLSSMLPNKPAAAVITLIVMLSILLLEAVVPDIRNPWLSAVLIKAMPSYHLDYFESGIISLYSVLYFLSITALFLFFTERAIERRRWS